MPIGPVVTLTVGSESVSIFANQAFQNIEQLATYLQLRINAIEKGTTYNDLIALENGQLVVIGDNEQIVNLAGVNINTDIEKGPPGRPGPAGPTGDIAAIVQIAIILVVVIAVVGIMIAFGRYLEYLDYQSIS